MERGSTKHSPRLDEQQKHEARNAVLGTAQGSVTGRAEEWREPEPMTASEEELQSPGPRPPGHEPGSPEGMDAEDVDRRSDLARWISGVHAFPAGKADLLARAEAESAPDAVLTALHSLPDRDFQNLEEVAGALGITDGRHPG